MDMKAFSLNNGKQLPTVGFGTYKLRKEQDVLRAVDEALAAGYRLFDTAAVYGNETHLKKAFQMYLPKYGLSREELFIISKLSPYDMHKTEIVKEAYERSLKNLGVTYLDMYLIHFPGQPHVDPTHPVHKILRNTAWAAITQLYDEGLVDAIGVSNFTVGHLQDLIIENHSVIPAVNQVEWHPYYHEDGLFRFCHEEGIQLQGYSPLGGPKSCGALLADPVVQRIASKLKVTPAQVLVAWSLQTDVPTIPKSKTPAHIRANYDLDFKLTDEQMKLLNNLSSGKKFAWDPSPFI